MHVNGDETFYRLDATDDIIEVGGAWDGFAQCNGGSHLVAEHIVGQNLARHVTGLETGFFLRTMFEGVRRLRRPKLTTYRCDSTDVKRFVEMTVTPEAEAGLLVTHRVLRTEPLRVPVFVLQVPAYTSASVCRCSNCNRLSQNGGNWNEPDDTTPTGQQIRVVHVVCQDCYRTHLGIRSGDAIFHSHDAILRSRAAVSLRAVSRECPKGNTLE